MELCFSKAGLGVLPEYFKTVGGRYDVVLLIQMYFFNKCLNYSSVLGPNQAEAPGALFLNGMQN